LQIAVVLAAVIKLFLANRYIAESCEKLSAIFLFLNAL
jgi:hypothetical protein